MELLFVLAAVIVAGALMARRLLRAFADIEGSPATASPPCKGTCAGCPAAGSAAYPFTECTPDHSGALEQES